MILIKSQKNRKRILLLSFLSFTFFHSPAQTTIKMEKESGVYIIPCKVNDLKLKFIFDTGASKVCISLTEALFMIKNGYLEESDILGSIYSQTASGDVVEGNKVILRKIEFGGLQLTNVEAIITKELSAPLLLGQSAISRLGTYQINPISNELMIINGARVSPISSIESNNSTNGGTSSSANFKEVKIGTQIWMVENLNVSTFRNGDPIPQAKSAEEWRNAGDNQQPAWCYYDNDPANGVKYGKLYNWFAVNDPRGLTPNGWHIPADEEWSMLIDLLGGEGLAAKKMKDKNAWHKGGNGNNSSGFSGLPGGFRIGDGSFGTIGNSGYWWSSTSLNRYNASYIGLDYDYNGNENLGGFRKEQGQSVRCIRD